MADMMAADEGKTRFGRRGPSGAMRCAVAMGREGGAKHPSQTEGV